ncbi:hypothetical protein [Allorhodopirellula solitaria]|uniref:Uncharacterized protein n=1 Tax=Allorhodopirellula solitaria TaxID=2527987 RepID=A0A5C5XS06_9BACT|nr:hypothetical protein [Allorhodopirellula solitaria]TWT66026.1 hypothetical protein CA85_28870 [Allorhodopirellula solitaria]
MSFSSEAPFDANPPCSGNDCADTVSLDWRILSERFDSDLIETEFGAEIDEDLVEMHSRLGRFVTKSSSLRRGR